jgi:hypothetical protein
LDPDLNPDLSFKEFPTDKKTTNGLKTLNGNISNEKDIECFCLELLYQSFGQNLFNRFAKTRWSFFHSLAIKLETF